MHTYVACTLGVQGQEFNHPPVNWCMDPHLALARTPWPGLFKFLYGLIIPVPPTMSDLHVEQAG